MTSSTFELPGQSLSDKNFALRPLSDADKFLYQSASEDPEIIRRFGPLPDSPEAMITKSRESWDDGSLATLAIDPRTGAAVGVVMVEPGPTSRANIGFWLLRDQRGRGYATRALVLTSKWAFDALAIKRLQLFCEADNVPSQRVAERAGYQREGVLRSYFQIGQERSDAFVYSLLPSDRREMK
jgi:RimJ/RimL family protein N-acetyltransferase